MQLEKNQFIDGETMNRIREKVEEEGKTLFSFTQEYCDKLRP